jgi:hypothetical protein
LLSYLSNFVVLEESMNLYVLEIFSSKFRSNILKSAAGSGVEQEMNHHLRSFCSNMVDNYDYHLSPPDKYAEINREKTLSYFKDISNTVSVDVDIETEVLSTKVIQIQEDVPVFEFVNNLVQKKFPQTFREVISLVDSLWLFISINAADEDVPLYHNSR